MIETLKRVLYIAVSVYILAVVIDWFHPNDSTDALYQRSGMSLHVDSLTGCHYLSKPFGGITPRLWGDGQHYGCRNFQAEPKEPTTP